MRASIFRWATIILAIISFGIAAFFVGWIYYTEKEYAEGDAVYEDILADVVISEEEVLGESSEPASETGEQEEDTVETVQEENLLVPEIDFASLKAINGDVVGWLYLPDTVINYPVVQGSDNSYYLKRLVDGSYNANGSLFVDYQNEMDFSDDNTLIYGHHMDSGKMFATLVKYKNQEFYDEHPVAYFLTEEKTYKIEIFSGYVTTPDSDSYLLTAGSRQQTIEWMKEMFHNSDFFADVTIRPEDHIVTFSTCDYEFHDARYVVHGKMTVLEEGV